MTEHRIRFAVVLALCLLLGIAWSAQELPARLSDEAFWKVVTDFSEPGGRFVSDNFVSNELATQYVLSDLTQDRKASGAYLGVGPEQNFTYIVALKPKIAFIVDIRRGNRDLHLMYKALFELSTDRADFVSRLFSKKRPDGIGAQSTVTEIFDAYAGAETSDTLRSENLRAIVNQLVKKHRFALTGDDMLRLQHIYSDFCSFGPDLQYSSTRNG